MPRIRQFFVERRNGDADAFERKLYVIRRRLHKAVEETHDGYVVSLSSRKVIYKGLLKGGSCPLLPGSRGPRLPRARSRWSTSLLDEHSGSWELAHPYRYVAHNGEINTLRGNVN